MSENIRKVLIAPINQDRQSQEASAHHSLTNWLIDFDYPVNNIYFKN